MERLFYNLLFVAMNCVLLNCAKRIENNLFSPYGPMMCKKWCEDSVTAFRIYYVKKDLSCHRNLAIDFRVKGDTISFACFGKKRVDDGRTSLAFKSLNDSCDTDSKGGALSHRKQQLIAEYIASKSLETNPNETLYEACKEGKLCVVEYIISQALADINYPGEKKRTPVMIAAGTGQETLFNYLFRKRCDLSAVDEHNDTVLHFGCSGGSIAIVRKLVDSGQCDMERRDSQNGGTPAMYAVFYNHKEVLELLVSKGCSLASVDNLGNNILHSACLKGYLSVVRYIISLDKIDIERRGFKERTPLMFAVEKGHIRVFVFLVNKGCNIMVRDEDDNDLLHLACMCGQMDMVQYILSKNINRKESRGFSGRTPVLQAAVWGYIQLVKLLESKGADMRAVDSKGNSVLHVACLRGHVDIVKYILSQNISNIESRGELGRTPVMIAAWRGHIRVVKFLASNNCNMKAVDKNQETVLHLACSKGRIDVVKYLITLRVWEGIQKNKYGQTYLQLAQLHGHTQVVALLKRRG